MTMVNGFPRRARLEHMTPAERCIHEAIVEVEKLGASPLLTSAVMSLMASADLVSDYIDSHELHDAHETHHA